MCFIIEQNPQDMPSALSRFVYGMYAGVCRLPPPCRAPLDETGEQSALEMSYLDWSSMLLKSIDLATRQDAVHLLVQNKVLEAGHTNRCLMSLCPMSTLCVSDECSTCRCSPVDVRCVMSAICSGKKAPPSLVMAHYISNHVCARV